MTKDEQRKILEAAAKACGIEYWVVKFSPRSAPIEKIHTTMGGETVEWNPITNSADTAEMCAKLGVNSEWDLVSDAVICDVNWDDTCTYPTVTSFFSNYANSRLKAWMYAATMCAAKIGGYTE